MINTTFISIGILLVMIAIIFLYILDVINNKIVAISMTISIVLGILFIVFNTYIDPMEPVIEDFPYRTDYISEVNGERSISTEVTNQGKLYLSYVTSSGKEKLPITENPKIIISDKAKVLYYKRIKKGNLFYVKESDVITICLPEEDLPKVLVFDIIDYD